ncbi:MAG: hypothetical protein KF720_00015 [Rubrivivax sp.]|nr:hypothetical protein [Rhizobacter sp.]MBX3641436.1 hypothetical protein [Rubrivivax sp.]
MQRTTIHIHREAAPKPAVGEPCNGCGVCCTAEPCPVGMLVSRSRHGACKALTWNEHERRYACGMVVAPQRFGVPRWLAGVTARAVRRLIAAGRGCDCDLSIETG